MLASLPAAAHTVAGRPSYQHDRHIIHHTPTSSLYAVADGHGSPAVGHTVSHLIARTLPELLHSHQVFNPSHDTPSRLRQALASLEKSAIAHTSAARVYAGSTLCAVLRMGDTLFCANVGDSRAVVVPAIGHARPLSTDHVCTHPAEKARIEKAGGVVIGGLLNGYISMSRAIGDDDLKAHRNLTPFPFRSASRFAKDMFVGDPDVTFERVRDADTAVVVASDGVWGSLSNHDVAAVVRSEIYKGRSPAEIARAVVKKAISKGSKDNVTAVVAFLCEDTVVRNLISEGRKRRGRLGASRRGASTPRSVMDMVKEIPLDEGWDSPTGTSSDGGASQSADAFVKTRTEGAHADVRKHQSADDGRRLRRFKWGSRSRTTLR